MLVVGQPLLRQRCQPAQCHPPFRSKLAQHKFHAGKAGHKVADAVVGAFAVALGCGAAAARSSVCMAKVHRKASNRSSALSDDFPWSFTGRVRFRPALLRAIDANVADGVQVLSLFGFTLGGSVCLEYDTSPVGRYLEVVQMAAAVFSERMWTTALWGSRLMVSEQVADAANGDVWGVPSELRDIAFDLDGDPAVKVDAQGGLRVGGWDTMRFAAKDAESWGQLPIWWTPTLKALWLPISPWRDEAKGGTLPLRQLRLSAAAVRLRWAPAGPDGDTFVGSELDRGDGRIPLPLVVEADGVIIEIGNVIGTL